MNHSNMRNHLRWFLQNIRTEILVVWGIASAIFLTTAVSPFVLTDLTLFQISSFVRFSEFHGDCFLCGMTRAYIAISNLDLVGATKLNAFSLPLWTFSVLNFGVMIKHSISQLFPYPTRRSR